MRAVSVVIATLAVITLGASALDFSSIRRQLRRGVDDAMDALKHGQKKLDAALGAGNPLQLCSANTDMAVLFATEADCNTWAASPLAASPFGASVPNCTTASYCFSAGKSGTISTNFNTAKVLGIAVQNAWQASFQFSTQEYCLSAQNASASAWVASQTCVNSVLSIGHSSGYCATYVIGANDFPLGAVSLQTNAGYNC